MDGSIYFVWRIGRFVLLMGVLYSVAAAVYVSQIPERWAPGMFDYSVRPPRTHARTRR
jgi:predicted membrane channel-forming protein YqfA (hemolysin III family)